MKPDKSASGRARPEVKTSQGIPARRLDPRKKAADAARSRARKGSVAKRPSMTRPRVALAMAGGGPLGAIYEIGALAALAESFEGLDLTRLDIYVGVSAGGILGAGLANGITPREMCRIFIETPAHKPGAQPAAAFDPAMLMRPAFAEYWSRARKLPRQMGHTLWQYAVSGRGRGPAGILGAAEHLLQLFPTGLFSNEPLRAYLADIFSAPGRTDDFRKLPAHLYLIATDLDSGQAVEFGAPGHDEIPISVAATASSALPGLFPPVEIGGRYFVDGALKRTLHASVALKEGADLVICLNPLVPFDDRSVAQSASNPGRLVDGGLPSVVLQTIRAVIRSRMEIGMRQYVDDYPQSDVILFEPDRDDAKMFFSNMFSYSNRRQLCEHAYQKTRAEIWSRRHELQPLLRRHGVGLDLAALRDKSLTLVSGTRIRTSRGVIPLGDVAERLDETLRDLQRFVAHARNRGLANRA